MMRKILGALSQADRDFNLINDNDKIAVGVSGGKDSLALLKVLKLYQTISKKQFDIIAIHVLVGFPFEDLTKLEKFCHEEDILFLKGVSNPNIYETLKKHLTKDGRLLCSMCSKMKKAAIIKTAKEYSCNKIAYAHHADDAIETFFLNMIYGGKLSTIIPNLYLSKENTTIIRPLIYCREKEIISLSKKLSFPIIKNPCPNEDKTKRSEIKKELIRLYELYPDAYKNFLTMLSNKDNQELWDIDNK